MVLRLHAHELLRKAQHLSIDINRLATGQLRSWLREMDWQLTFSEIVSPNLVEGEELGSNVLLNL
jgi:hypothetical protein